ncbi:MAG: RNA 3'-terminal phosphate cyclase [Planctomycetota bacterium]
MIEIDGSKGEGGGQVLRTSLTLSLLTGKPFRIARIRAGREVPGLRPQHLECVRAAARISRAAVEGDREGSQALSFSPGPVSPGAYEFRIATAGALTLVLQTVLLPLLRARGPSLITLSGGTHVPWSPTIDYVARVFLPSIEAAGYPPVPIEVLSAGYYPKGGGEVKLAVPEWDPAGVRPLDREDRGRVLRVRGVSNVSSLPPHVSDRQAGRAEARLAAMGWPYQIERVFTPSCQPGTSLLLVAETEGGPIGASALGQKGKPAERVADEACDELARLLASDGAVDPHLADQLVLPLALIAEESAYTTTEVTPHLRTVLEVVRAFLPADLAVQELPSEPDPQAMRGRQAGAPGRVVVLGPALP